MSICLVLSTFPDAETAQRIASALVEEGLAACVNIIPGAQSIYRWEGKIESAGEVLALAKTTLSGYAHLEERLKELHPYSVPEIVALPVERAQAAYAQWVAQMVKSD